MKIIKLFIGPNNYHISNVYEYDEDEVLIGIDSGCELLIQEGLIFSMAIGDFDSIHPEYMEKMKSMNIDIIELPKHKDQTDLAYALEYIYNHMIYDEVRVYGGLGGRVDHLLANINLIKKYQITFRDDHHLLYVLKKGKHVVNHPFKHISFFAIEDVYQLNLKGFEYELNQYYLSTMDSIGVSNEGSGIVEFTKGKLLVVCSDEL